MDDFTIGCAHNMNPPVDNKERHRSAEQGRLSRRGKRRTRRRVAEANKLQLEFKGVQVFSVSI